MVELVNFFFLSFLAFASMQKDKAEKLHQYIRENMTTCLMVIMISNY